MKVHTKKIMQFIYLAWSGGIVLGFGMLWRHENVPGLPAHPPADWPSASRIERSAEFHTLVMLAHPKCPCTRASVGELGRLMAQSKGRAQAHVLMYRPSGTEEGWAHTDIWKSAAAIPGVTVTMDIDGVEARYFGAETSGQTLLYDPLGKLLFSGGITGSRGHAGDNSGRDAVVSLLLHGISDDTQTEVFGCSLNDRRCENEGKRL